jgi:hypothetical protein
MLEGNELEGKIGDVGSYSLDVDDKGNVKFTATVNKDLGYAKASSATSVEANIFNLAEEIAKKTNVIWDDTAIAALKKLLGIE